MAHCLALGTEEIPLEQSWRRILREDLHADRDFPPFDRVTMDGIAIRYADFVNGRRLFPVAGLQAAGGVRQPLEQAGTCLEVMTGAVLPEGADTVIRYEDLRMANGQAEILIESIVSGQNVHRQGTDRKAGDRLVPAGRRIAAPEIATAATVGKGALRVARLPRVAVVSTGDELVSITEMPLSHQIRRSNGYAVQAILQEQLRLESQLFHFADDKDRITRGLQQMLADFDLIILTGAVSEGKYDFVPQVLDALCVEQCFHKVAQRPGKPFWFGRLPRGAVVFALPGNPVSAFVCTWRYVLPYLYKSLGVAPAPQPVAVLGENLSFRPRLTYFLPVRLLSAADGTLQALPVPGHGSGDLANLNEADAFLELPPEQDHFCTGEIFPVYPFR